MKLQGLNILLISPEPWGHLFVSKHHYATHLAERGNFVYFLGPPSQECKVENTQFENVFRFDYKGFPKGLRFYPAFLQQYFIKREFERLQVLCGVNFDIVWSFDNSVFYDFSALPSSVYCISHIVDLNQDFQTGKAASTANICLGVIPEIVERLKVHNKKSFLISHGVSLGSKDLEVHLPGNNAIKAIYIGNLSMPFIDWELLRKLINKEFEVDFIFLGSNHQSVPNDLLSANNCYFIDRVPSEEINAYLKVADILLLAYTKEYYRNYASPHKMMEYLASGKVIVASWTDEYINQSKGNMLVMARNSEEYLANFKEVLHCLDEINSEEHQLLRRRFALDNTYNMQIERIQALINAQY